MAETPDIVCQIAAGDLAGQVVYRDEHVIAFLDHRPVFKGHVLVCPVRHVNDLTDLPDEEQLPLWSVVRLVARAMPGALGCTGTFVGNNNVVSQSVPHLHVHVVPRTRGDGLRGFFWPRTRYAEGEIETYGALLRRALTEQGR